jgi:hypothetical protein
MQKHKPPRPAVRAALRIHDHLAGAGLRLDRFAIPNQAWEDLQRIANLLPQTALRGWTTAYASLVEDLDYGARRVERELQDLRQQLPVRPAVSALSSPSSILGDLAALANDFDKVDIDLQQRTVSVLTDPIELVAG